MDNFFKLEEKIAFLGENHEENYSKLRETVKLHCISGKSYSLALDFCLNVYVNLLSIKLWHALSHQNRTALVLYGTDNTRVETRIDENHHIQVEQSESGLWEELDNALSVTEAVLHHTPLYIQTLRDLAIGCLTQPENGFFPDVSNAVFLALGRQMDSQRLNVFVQFANGAIVFSSEPKER